MKPRRDRRRAPRARPSRPAQSPAPPPARASASAALESRVPRSPGCDAVAIHRRHEHQVGRPRRQRPRVRSWTDRLTSSPSASPSGLWTIAAPTARAKRDIPRHRQHQPARPRTPRRPARPSAAFAAMMAQHHARRPRARARSPSHNRSPSRSSVISHIVGRVWRAGMALPIARGMTDAATRLATVRAEIARAARLARRDPAEITLVAVSKRRSVDEIEALIAAGPARLRRKPGAGSAGQMARPARRASRRPPAHDRPAPVEQGRRGRRAVRRHPLARPPLAARRARRRARPQAGLRPGQHRRGRAEGRRRAGRTRPTSSPRSAPRRSRSPG